VSRSTRESNGNWPSGAARTVRPRGRRPAGDACGYLFQDVPSAIRHGEDGRWKAYSPLEHLTAEHATILCDSEVLGVLTQNGVTCGVRIRRRGRRPWTSATEKVVLAAGTIESSRLAIQALSNEGLLDRPQLTAWSTRLPTASRRVWHPAVCPPRSKRPQLPTLNSKRAARDGLRSNIFLMTSVNEHGLIVLRTSFIGEQIAGPLGVVGMRRSRCMAVAYLGAMLHVACRSAAGARAAGGDPALLERDLPSGRDDRGAVTGSLTRKPVP